MQTPSGGFSAPQPCPATPERPRRSCRAALLLWLACAVAPLCSTQAQAGASHWPDRAVRLIVPFSAGGATDTIGRTVGQRLATLWKQSVVVENKTGAGGAVGAESAARSDPDGYTLLLASGSMFTVNPFIYDSLPYTLADFAPISNVASGPMVLAVNPALPVHSLQEFVAYVRARPGKVNFGSAGVGTQTHMAAEQLADTAGLAVAHIPYKGESAALADLMAGHIDFVVGNIAAVTPLLASERVRALTVSGNSRSAMLPDVPSAAEAGQPGFQASGWFALMAPAHTPPALVARIQHDLSTVLTSPDTRKTFAAQGSSAAPSTPTALAERIRSEAAMWQAIVSRRRISNH